MSIPVGRDHFPILKTSVHGKPLVYLDNAATTQLPEEVLRCLEEHYRTDNANVHRGVHALSVRSTEKLEETREALAAFLGARSAADLVFTSGVTESINLVAESYLEPRLREGDRVIVSVLEHHSNYLPWQDLCRKKNAELLVLTPEEADHLEDYLDERTRLAAVAHVSNTNGYRFPLADMVRKAHEKGIPVLVDGAQAVRSETIDIRSLDPDFYTVSGHKMFAPAGTGVLAVTPRLRQEMKPVRFGGGMIAAMRADGTPVWEDFPYCLEAGTPNYAGLIAWKAAVDFIGAIGREEIAARERSLSDYLENRLKEVPGVRILGENKWHRGAVSFELKQHHPFDAAVLLDLQGIAVRSGHHCAIPAHRYFGEEVSLRASTAFYNTEEEIDRFAECLTKVCRQMESV